MTGIGPSLALNNGVEIPQLGLGTYLSDEGPEVEQAVAQALDIGYRHIDTASFYGNEEGIGRAIAMSGVPRQEIFLTSKVWNDEQGFDETLAAVQRSLERLGTGYLDLYLVHWPRPMLMEDTWRAMEAIADAGKARAIGVSNFLPHHLDQLASFAETPPALNQVEFHPRLQSPAVVEACRARGILLEAWSPLMRGRVFDAPEIVLAASSHGRTPAQIVLRWLLQRGIVAIPKSVRPERLRENADVFDFALTDEEMAAIGAMDRGERVGPHPDVFPGG